jgi:uncharacterized protein YjeT (DUF2065 family)
MPDKAGSGPSPLEQLVAAKESEKKAQRKKDSRVLAAIALAAVVVIGGGVLAFVHFAPQSWRQQVTALVKSSASARSSPTATPAVKLTIQPLSPVDTDGPPSDPFSGTPAEHWADGAAGITIPAARAHGPYSAAQVRSAYKMTRKLLIAGNLDWPTLRGGAPKAFEDLLISQQRTYFLSRLHTTKLDKNGAVENSREWITTFAPGSTRFVTSVVKVRGTMKAGTATDSGSTVLRIKFDYLFVYVVEPPGNPAGWMRIVQQRSGTVDFARWDAQGSSLEPWYQVAGLTAGGRCDTHDGYVHPDYPAGPPSTVQPSGKPVDPYASASTAPVRGCQATTGT